MQTKIKTVREGTEPPDYQSFTAPRARVAALLRHIQFYAAQPLLYTVQNLMRSCPQTALVPHPFRFSAVFAPRCPVHRKHTLFYIFFELFYGILSETVLLHRKHVLSFDIGFH